MGTFIFWTFRVFLLQIAPPLSLFSVPVGFLVYQAIFMFHRYPNHPILILLHIASRCPSIWPEQSHVNPQELCKKKVRTDPESMVYRPSFPKNGTSKPSWGRQVLAVALCSAQSFRADSVLPCMRYTKQLLDHMEFRCISHTPCHKNQFSQSCMAAQVVRHYLGVYGGLDLLVGYLYSQIYCYTRHSPPFSPPVLCPNSSPTYHLQEAHNLFPLFCLSIKEHIQGLHTQHIVSTTDMVDSRQQLPQLNTLPRRNRKQNVQSSLLPQSNIHIRLRRSIIIYTSVNSPYIISPLPFQSALLFILTL